MIYRRVPIVSSPSGGFLFALVVEGTNALQVGVGHESASGLNISHITTLNLKPAFAYEYADQIEAGGIELKTARLAPLFNDNETLLVVSAPRQFVNGALIPDAPEDHDDLSDEQRDYRTANKRLAQAMREVHDEAWGNPRDWDVEVIPLDKGRCGWIAYDSVIDKIRIGIGFYAEDGTHVLGDQSFSVGQRLAGDFAADCYTNVTPLLFFSKPPRWPEGMSHIVGHANKQKIAIAFLKLADEVWRGKVQTTGRRPLTAEEIERVNGGVGAPAS